MRTSHRFVAVQWALQGLLVASLFTPGSEPLRRGRLPGGVLVLVGAGLVLLAASNYRAANRAMIRTSPEPDPSAHLVTRGLYGYVRHPIYLGVMVGAFGLALLRGSFWSLGVAGALGFLFYLKSRYEETLLMQAFPDYADYRTRTGRFLPPLSRLLGSR
jgi:protein-S-isoprenylcysteine O-methyltransferase Ste14